MVCHCGDCSAYARQIGNLQANQIVQVAPAQMKILSGKERLRCLRLTERGLTRWFTTCCRTPIANTSRHAWMPFVGLMTCVLDVEGEALLGPATHVNGSHPVAWGLIGRSLWALMLGFLLRRHRPNVFFDRDGRLIAPPEIAI